MEVCWRWSGCPLLQFNTFLWFQIPNHLHRFFDIEAEVDREPEDDEDGDNELYGELRN